MSEHSFDIIYPGLGKFVQVPRLLIRHGVATLGMTYGEMVLVIAILSFKWKMSDPYPGDEVLSRFLGCSTRQVQHLFRSLKRKNLLETRQSGLRRYVDFTKLVNRLLTLAEMKEGTTGPEMEREAASIKAAYAEFDAGEEPQGSGLYN